ncbi:cilia- and flagella-associated protein 100-like [Physella acuta]|uniref:cilia- and flagella-associated protein 100-like n=1 Tax=Physella acuta TaxID=109671 RepID=UPI0027DCA065|nr:cilia- and flagella-associated protein 100-like [Physella acuta]XP_059171791.1 cilia- and flagella-associated protein 100-like [Physella acuta]
MAETEVPKLISSDSTVKVPSDGKVSVPNMPKLTVSGVTSKSESSRMKKNPFKMPPDTDIFLLRDKEKQKKFEERMRQRELKVHEKTTYASRVCFRPASLIHPPESDSDDEVESDKAVAVKDDPQFTIAITRDRHVEKESLSEYIAKKREMFLVQYSLGVKRDEMRKLEEIAQAEERKLELAEQYLEEDAALFDEFLKENDKNSVEAIKIAETEAKLKMEKVNEIKRINAQMMTIKSEISKYEDTLKEYQLYRAFLESLIPPEIQEERKKDRARRKEEKLKERDRVTVKRQSIDKTPTSKPNTRRGSLKSSDKAEKRKSKDKKADELDDSDEMEDSDEEMELYFTDPHQLLEIFAELEEQNLSLIQNSQETEEALEEMKNTIKQTKIKMEKETKTLKEQIDRLQAQIQKEEAKAADLKVKARMFNYGEFKADDDQEQRLADLNKKVEEVYRNCIGDNEANISTLQMLTNIENRLEELFEMIETMPQDKVEAAEKAKDKERRLKMREEKMEQLRIHQEERVKKALERAQAEPKKKHGKKLVFRSEPPLLKKKEDEGADQASREEEELQYYFAW